MRGRQRDGEIGHAMGAGEQAGENAGVGSVGDRAGGEGIRESDAVFRQSIKRRRLYGFVTVAMDVIGAESVDGDQEYVGRRFCRR